MFESRHTYLNYLEVPRSLVWAEKMHVACKISYVPANARLVYWLHKILSYFVLEVQPRTSSSSSKFSKNW